MYNYFQNREKRKERAIAHTRNMENLCPQQIEDCIKNTVTYGINGKTPTQPDVKEVPSFTCNVEVDGLDSVASLFAHKSDKTAVLNFASYKNPGGMFIEGSSAQEESLCHASFLYNVLKEKEDYYKWNKIHKNRALYTNRALYSQNVTFFSDDGRYTNADVITCAAPNYAAAEKYMSVLKEDNENVLYERIKFVLDVAEDNNVDTLILGAFGCGVFKQDAEVVAMRFRECLETYDYHFKNVYFSVLNLGKSDNYEKFEKIFKK